MIATPFVVLAVDDPGLLRMQFQPHFREAASDDIPHVAGLLLAQAALDAAYAMPVKEPCTGCHGAKQAAIQDALRRIGLCQSAAEILDPLAGRLRTALERLRQVPEDLGEVYELVYEFIRKGGKLPVYARWIEGEGTRTFAGSCCVGGDPARESLTACWCPVSANTSAESCGTTCC